VIVVDEVDGYDDVDEDEDEVLKSSITMNER